MLKSCYADKHKQGQMYGPVQIGFTPLMFMRLQGKNAQSVVGTHRDRQLFPLFKGVLH